MALPFPRAGFHTADTKKYRFERKYYLNALEAVILKQRVSWVLRPDTHSGGAYHISSLYFDDIYNTSLHQKQNGDLVRNKLRIRWYNNDTSFVRLEHKHKNGEMISKASVRMSTEQFAAIREGEYGFALALDHPLWRMFYTRRTTAGLAPVVTVEYDRAVYTYDPGNVRITFDSDLRASMPYSGAGLPVLPKGHIILEVKYDNFLPDVVAGLLRGPQLTQIAVSKYTMCRDAVFNAHYRTA